MWTRPEPWQTEKRICPPPRPVNWTHQGLSIREKTWGTGVFATRDFDAGVLLAIFGGYAVRVEEEDGDWGVQVENDFALSPMMTSDQAKDVGFFVNHSCSPNAGIRGQISLYSMRAIRAGEEVTFDYGSCLYSPTEADDYSFVCRCNSANCRGTITSSDWRLKSVQETHGRKFLPYFILDAIDEKSEG